MSVTQLGGAELRGLQIRRLDDTNARVANLFFGQSMGLASSARIALRGTGQNDPDSFIDPGVAVYLDGVYLARAQGQLLSLADVDLVEVTRGPQGTVFGKNALGGAINVVSRKPDFALGGDAELRVGNFGLFESRFSLNVPLAPEKAAARINVTTKTRDGYVKNQRNGDDYSDDKQLGGRGQLLLLPSQNVEVLFSADYSREGRKPLGGKCVPSGVAGGIASVPPMVTGFTAACARSQSTGDLKAASDVSFADDQLTTFGSSAQVVWDISPELSLLSLTSVRGLRNDRLVDDDGSPVNLFQPQRDFGDTRQGQLSQELRLNGRALGGRLSYVGGLYAFREKARERDQESFGFLPPTREEYRTNNLSYEAFGELSYALTDRLELTGGVRRTQERKRVFHEEKFTGEDARVPIDGAAALGALAQLPDASLNQVAQALGLPPGVLQMALSDPQAAAALASAANIASIADTLVPLLTFRRSARFGETSPSAALSYRLSTGALLYASYATGFRSGGFNGRAVSPEDTRRIKPEVLTSYEVGFKSQWLDGTLLLDGAAFYNIGKDVQLGLLSIDDVIGFTKLIRRNASRQVMTGGELSLGWRPVSGLQLGAELGLLRSRYSEFDDDLPDRSIANEQPVISPRYTLNLSAAYQVPSRLGSLGMRVNWAATGSYNNDVQGTKSIESGQYGLLDGRLSLGLRDGKTELALFGTNLLDRRYANGGIGFQESFGFATRFFGPPRFYGLELRRAF